MAWLNDHCVGFALLLFFGTFYSGNHHRLGLEHFLLLNRLNWIFWTLFITAGPLSAVPLGSWRRPFWTRHIMVNHMALVQRLSYRCIHLYQIVSVASDSRASFLSSSIRPILIIPWIKQAKREPFFTLISGTMRERKGFVREPIAELSY